MRFGQPGQFSVEAFHEPVDGMTGFGRMCVCVLDLQVGDIAESGCSLHNAAEDLERLADEAMTLWDSSFDGLSDDQIFELLDRALFVDLGQPEAKIEEDGERYWRFALLTNTGEHFDGYKVFAVRRDSCIHFLVQLPDDSIVSRVCDLSQVMVVLHEFLSWFRLVSAQPNGPMKLTGVPCHGPVFPAR